MSVSSRVDVAIIGGGITGLTAAWALQQRERSGPNGPSPTYALLESGPRWGGKILTETLSGSGRDPLVIEAGPDSFITQKPWAWALARELGLEERLLPTNDERRQVFVLHRGRPVPLPEGVMLIVPTRLGPFVRSQLISPWGKLRMALDWFVPPRLDGGDETLADFIRRRLGAEALDKIAEPLLAGIYNAEAERQSILATFPRFRAIEAEHGSLIRGMLAARRSRRPVPASNGRRPASAFVSLRGGMEELVDALTRRLTGDCRLKTGVEAIEAAAAGYRLRLQNGRIMEAESVILAVPAYVAARLLRPLAPHAAAGLDAIRYVSTGTVSLAFARDGIGHPLDGFGLVIPPSERRQINALTWTSTKFHYRAPDDQVLLRVFFGGSRTPHMMDLSDEALLRVVADELRDLMGIHQTPTLYRIHRWFDATPQYDVGHLDRVTAIEASLPAGLFVSGSPYRGIGIPDCVRQAQETADKVRRYIRPAPQARPKEGQRV